jgi:hypothetical protein
MEEMIMVTLHRPDGTKTQYASEAEMPSKTSNYEVKCGERMYYVNARCEADATLIMVRAGFNPLTAVKSKRVIEFNHKKYILGSFPKRKA